jgi:hypothetical protein
MWLLKGGEEVKRCLRRKSLYDEDGRGRLVNTIDFQQRIERERSDREVESQ